MTDLEILQAELEKYRWRKAELETKVVELSDFIENASIPLHWVDENGIIIWANQAELDVLGYSYDEYVGRPIADFHVDDAVISDILTRLIGNETLNNYPARLKTKDDSVRHVLISSNVYRKDGKFIHTRCFTKDITDIKKEQERKVAFVAMVSHELKTPLTSLMSYIQILLRRANKEHNDFHINALKRAESQAKKMGVMLTDFLSQAKYEEGQVILHQQRFNLSELITEVVDDAKFIFSKAFHIKVDCPAIWVFADRDKIGQVLINLISNAIKYSSEPGYIWIACDVQDLKVRVSVTDNGIGIEPADQERLFERFYRVHSSQSAHVDGFGIGLYLVSEILRYHHSSINVISEKGSGSTFYFDLQVEVDASIANQR
jgi:PAS domain S-box-containing protein